jgi:hypothetical protein
MAIAQQPKSKHYWLNRAVRLFLTLKDFTVPTGGKDKKALEWSWMT